MAFVSDDARPGGGRDRHLSRGVEVGRAQLAGGECRTLNLVRRRSGGRFSRGRGTWRVEVCFCFCRCGVSGDQPVQVRVALVMAARILSRHAASTSGCSSRSSSSSIKRAWRAPGEQGQGRRRGACEHPSRGGGPHSDDALRRSSRWRQFDAETVIARRWWAPQSLDWSGQMSRCSSRRSIYPRSATVSQVESRGDRVPWQ